jgi:hypothetical protein
VQVHVSAFWTPKRGGTGQEYEDAFWVGPDGAGAGDIQLDALTVAIADGASESLLAGRWAQRLVRSFGTMPDATAGAPGFLAAYRTAAMGWDDEVMSYLAERGARDSPIQWYEEPGLAKGAHATVAAVQFWGGQKDERAHWAASGVGDSCLFQVRDEAMLVSFPIADAAEFSYQPSLLSSRETEADVVRHHICLRTGEWMTGDTFYLATDALAAWFLRSAAEGGRPWEPLRDLDTIDAESDFPDWVEEMRDRLEMHDDDTTLIRIDAIRED